MKTWPSSRWSTSTIIPLPVPGGGEVAVHPRRLRAPFTSLPEVRQYQVLHDQAGLHVRVVLRNSAAPDTPARIRAALSHELQAAGATPPVIRVTPVAEIQRETGHGAKLKLVQTTVRRSGG